MRRQWSKIVGSLNVMLVARYGWMEKEQIKHYLLLYKKNPNLSYRVVLILKTKSQLGNDADEQMNDLWDRAFFLKLNNRAYTGAYKCKCWSRCPNPSAEQAPRLDFWAYIPMLWIQKKYPIPWKSNSTKSKGIISLLLAEGSLQSLLICTWDHLTLVNIISAIW